MSSADAMPCQKGEGGVPQTFAEGRRGRVWREAEMCDQQERGTEEETWISKDRKMVQDRVE